MTVYIRTALIIMRSTRMTHGRRPLLPPCSRPLALTRLPYPAVFMDWGLWRSPDGLRPQLLCRFHLVYYAAMPVDLLLRLLWTISLLPQAAGGPLGELQVRERIDLPARVRLVAIRFTAELEQPQ
jgi:hypothetical protein